AGLSALGGAVSPSVNAAWLRQTTVAARAVRAGASPAGAGVTEVTDSLFKGVVRAMTWDKVKYIALAVLLATGLLGFSAGRWGQVSAAPEVAGPRPNRDGAVRAPDGAPGEVKEAAGPGDKAARPDEARPAPGRRREAVIRMPSGTFVMEVEAAPYGSGRISWTYEDDRGPGPIDVSVMGSEVELATESEISLSSNGTIYGLITGVHLNRVRLPQKGEFKEDLAEIQPFLGLWPLVEPLLLETLTDLPFSYHFRVQGDRLVLSHFRILLAGPNPGGKIGSAMLGDPALIGCRGLGTALEGTYISSERKAK